MLASTVGMYVTRVTALLAMTNLCYKYMGEQWSMPHKGKIIKLIFL